MAFEEQIDQYKSLDSWKRFTLVAVIGMAFPVYMMIEDGESIASQLTLAQTKQSTARRNFERAKKNKSKIPELEKEVEEKQAKIEETQRVLPSDFNIDEILHQTARAARETGVEMRNFDPGEAREEKLYSEYPIALDLEASFSQTALFLDRLVHMDNLTHLRNLALTANLAKPTDIDTTPVARISTTVQMIVFIEKDESAVK